MATAMLRQQFPWQCFKKAWEHGVASMYIPADYTAHTEGFSSVGFEALQPVSGPLKHALKGHHSVQIPLAQGAGRILKDRYFPLMMNRPVVAAAPASQHIDTPKVTFEVKGQNVVLQGRHIPYQNAEVASIFLIDAHEKSDPDGSRTLFLVDKHALGIDVQMSHDMQHISTPIVCFHNVLLPRDNMIGQFGDGIRLSDITQDLLQNCVL